MTGEAEVACLGETMVQVVPLEGTVADAETFAMFQAGAESNVAIGLARLGVRSAWVGAVGADPQGERVLAALAREGVDVGGARVDPARPTGLFVKDVTDAERPVTYYRAGSAGSALGPGDVATATAAGLVHTSGITAALSADARAAVRALLAGPTPVSFDVNHRAVLWQDPHEAARISLELAGAADIVFVGLDEAEAMWATPDADAVLALLPAPRTVVVKDGPRPVHARHDGVRSVLAPAPVEVVDPVGAGDAFAAGVLAGLVRGARIETALRAGAAMAALALAARDDFGDPAGAAAVARLLEEEA